MWRAIVLAAMLVIAVLISLSGYIVVEAEPVPPPTRLNFTMDSAGIA